MACGAIVPVVDGKSLRAVTYHYSGGLVDPDRVDFEAVEACLINCVRHHDCNPTRDSTSHGFHRILLLKRIRRIAEDG